MTFSTKKILGDLALIFIVTPALLMWDGLALSTLWDWFVTPLGVRPIGIAMAIGLTLTAGLLRARYRKSDDEGRSARIAFAIVSPGLALGVGWIVKQFL